MPRRSRYDLPGTIHHVCIRGIEGRPIFVDGADGVDLLLRYQHWSLETKSITLAWSRNGNHLHVVIVRGEQPMGVLMARFSSAFAQRFNWRHERRGHLFMGRYESRVICDDADLRWMVLYASANAVRHAAMSEAALEHSPDSSWAGMMGTRDALPFESFDLPLALYGDDTESARKNLRNALAQAVATKWASPRDVRLAALVEGCCARARIERSELGRLTQRAQAARHEIIHRALVDLRFAPTELSAKLAVSLAQIDRVRRGRKGSP
jgi:REP element-mobilizing transposase RayT